MIIKATGHNRRWLMIIALSFVIYHLSFISARAQTIDLTDTISVEPADSSLTQAKPYQYRSHWNSGWYSGGNLHKGLNVNLGTSVFANWGGGHHHGTGFTQDISLAYVTDLSPKMTLAIGGYVDNTTWHGNNYTVAGINAMLNYRINDHWSAYAFVQKAVTSDNVGKVGWYGRYGYYPMGMYGYGRYGFAPCYGVDQRYMDRIGAGLRYEWGKYNQNSIQIHVEYDHMPQHNYYYDTGRYDYPVR